MTPEQWNRFVTVNATAPIMMTRAVLPHMLQAKRGRIITVTTSLGTMVRGGYLLYGASKAAAEAAMAGLSADLDGTGVTSNVLVPGGVTNTPLVGEDAGDRSRMLQPEIMVPPLLWLVSDAAAAVNGRRFIAADWDAGAAAGAGGGKSRRADRLDEHRADADRALRNRPKFIAAPGGMLRGPWQRRTRSRLRRPVYSLTNPEGSGRNKCVISRRRSVFVGRPHGVVSLASCRRRTCFARTPRRPDVCRSPCQSRQEGRMAPRRRLAAQQGPGCG